MTSTELVSHSTLEELLGWRERAIGLAEEARQQYVAAMDKISEARGAAQRAAPSHSPFYKLGDHIEGLYKEPEKLAIKVRHDLDRSMWQHLLAATGIEGLMDKQAIDEFTRQIQSDPPEVTGDNVRATFRQFKADSHVIFRRGLVNAFVSLDRTFRSHDGFKIGSRLVRSYALSDYGSIYDSAAVVRDVDRIMHILDGHTVREGWTSPLVHVLGNIRHGFSNGITPGTIDTDFWHAKWFKNRNLHLYPKRKDLVRRANRLIAEHFDDALGAGPDASGARRYERAKPHHAAVEDFFPTPAAVVEQMIAAAQLKPGLDVLEPSAGEGAIASAIMASGFGLVPDCVEVDPDRADTLRDLLPPGAVIAMDFLSMHAEPEYDRILMNPPFGKGAGIQHVIHALRFLKPGGRLVCILGIGMEYREDGPTRHLRGLMEAWDATTTRLPSGSFRPSGTNVEAVMIAVTKPILALPAPSSDIEDGPTLAEAAD